MRTEKRTKRVDRVVAGRQQGVVVLEDITDPHNAAAVVRSCDAYGIQDVYLIFNQEARFDLTTIGKMSSSSANKWVDFHEFDSVEKCFNELRDKGYTLFGTIVDNEAGSIFTTDLTVQKIGLVFGNEHRGLTPAAVAGLDHKVYIPMRGMTESLNLSVTVATCLFEMTRQRQVQGGNYALTQDQQNSLRKRLLER